jgi:hypothetical protein
MIRTLAALSLLLAACPASAIERKKTVYLDRMAGFERHVRSAILESGVWITLIDESIQPDYRMFLDPKFRNVHAEIMYKKSTGRAENAVLELFDVKAKKVRVRFSFKLTDDEMEQREAARQFVEKMRKSLNLKDKPAEQTNQQTVEPLSGAAW